MDTTRGVLTVVAAIVVAATGPAVGAAPAEVLRSEPTAFAVQHVAEVPAAPLDVYRGLVDDVADWWDPAHTFSGDAAGLSIDARPQGCFCETFPGGGGAMHLTVVNADPGKLLRLAGGLGPLQAEAVVGTLTWLLEETPGGTRVTVTYAAAGGVEGGLEAWAPPVDRVVGEQLERLVDHLTPDAD